MKIVIDARLYGLEHAGLGRYTLNLVNQLIKTGSVNDYTILLRKKYFDELEFPKNWKKVLAEFRHYSVIEQIRLPGMLSREHPDLVHFPHFNIPIMYKGNFVVTIHDLLMQAHRGARSTTLPMYLYYFKQIGSKIVFDKAVRDACKIIVPSIAVKKEVVDYFKIDGQRVVVTYEGVDDIFKNTLPAEDVLEKYKLGEKYFIYTGNAYPHKNLERAIEAIVRLNQDTGEKIIFAIVSSRNIFTKRIEDVIKRLRAENCVRLLGYVPDKDLCVLYAKSVGFLYPSLSEGFGLPALEAIASGTLAIVSDIPVFREIYANNAIYFNPYDFSSIQETLGNVLKMDHKKRNELIKVGKKYVTRYSWQEMTTNTLDVYRGCVV